MNERKLIFQWAHITYKEVLTPDGTTRIEQSQHVFDLPADQVPKCGCFEGSDEFQKIGEKWATP